MQFMVDQTLGGRYRMIQLLGQGGFGVTFLAEDIQRPGNPKCVVKQFRPMSTDSKTFDAGKRLFHREAQTLEKLGVHKQIPRLLAHFEEEQQFYLVQEYIEGHDLEQELLSGQKFSEDEVIKLLQDILEVLIFVHEKNHVHRDLKPSNIRRRPDGTIVLIDFGAVKQISTQIINSQGGTSYSVAIGTRGYMPGEQAQGFPQFNSDIYALGVIAIQALTGTTPHNLVTDHQTGEIDWRHSLNVVVNPELGDILDGMIRYDFRQRYRSARTVLDALNCLSDPAMCTKTLYGNPLYNKIRKGRNRSAFSSKLIKILIGLGVTASLAAGFVVWNKFSPRNELLEIAQPVETFSTYENNSRGLKIKHPTSWEAQNIEDPIATDVVIFNSPHQNSQDNFIEHLTISVRRFPGTLKDSQTSFVNIIKDNFPEAKIIRNDTATLAYRPANKLIYTREDRGKTFKSLLIWTLKGDRAYTITYTATINEYDTFIQDVNQMIESFEIR